MNLALFLLMLAPRGEVPPGILIDRVIAIVDKEVITNSELAREARVALVLREDARVAASELSPEILRSFLEFLVDQVVIAGQARRVGGVDVRSDEVDREIDHFAGRFSSVDAYRAFMRRFDISETALGDILRRDLRNERYITQRMRAWRAVLDEGQTSTGAQYKEALDRWVKELRAGVELRLLGPSGELELQ
jgi:hypothetical protein